MKVTITEARLRSYHRMRYFAQQVMSLVPVETPGLGTMAVDEYWRMYYDPAALQTWTLDECAGVCLHELCHLLQRHPQRRKALLPNATEEQLFVSNLAADITINDMLREAKVTLPQGCCYSEVFGVPPNLSYEEYYHLLWKQCQGKPKMTPGKGQGQGSGQGQGKKPGKGNKPGKGTGEGQGEQGDPGQPGGGGSCADGVPRPWEQGPPTEGKPGITKAIEDILRQAAAVAVDQAKGQGTLPGALAKWADTILRPKVAWQREIPALVRHAISYAGRGHGDYSYARPNRRAPAGLILPTMVKPVIRVAVVFDTSGSMGKQDTNEAMAELAGILKACTAGTGVRFLAADSCIQEARSIVKASDVVELLGGGGTDMGGAIEYAANEKPAPHVIICLTDGLTDWPSKPLRQQVIACITSGGSASAPSWIKTVRIEK